MFECHVILPFEERFGYYRIHRKILPLRVDVFLFPITLSTDY
jgi:hypothetical protein